MPANTLDLRQKRLSLVNELRTIVDTAQEEKRDLTSEENDKYSKILADTEKLKSQIDREERLAELEKEMRETPNPVERPHPGSEENPEVRNKHLATKEYREGFRHWIATGRGFDDLERRALQADINILGGYVVLPEQSAGQFLKNVDDLVYVRKLATKFQLDNANSLGAPQLTTDPSDADWTSELDTGSEDSDMAFGKRELKPHPLAKRIKISNKLLRSGSLDVEAFVLSRLAYKFSLAEEKAYFTGDGVGKPLGLFTPSTSGINTDRHFSSGNTATDIEVDGLLTCKFALKAQYLANAQWGFHRNGLERLSKKKDGNGQYIWQPGAKVGSPDLILGHPYFMSEYIPNTFTSGKLVGIFGDFSHYWIADALDMQIQRLVETSAHKNQTEYIARLESDGAPTIAEAFGLIKLP